MVDKEPKLVLIDGSGYLFRAFYGLPPMTRSDGTPVNAVFGFSSMIFRLLQDWVDDDIVILFDHSRKSFRTDLYPEYKQNREAPPEELIPQFALVREAGRAFNLPVVELPGYEADDLIATYTRLAREQGREVVIASSDKDLMQLIEPGTGLWDPMKSKKIDNEEVLAKFGVLPALVRDCLALAGDTSDNIPGVPGIGVKTAAQLLNEYGSLEQILERAQEIKQPKRRQSLIDFADQARLSQKLVSLDDDAPIPIPLDETVRRDFDPAVLLAFLKENNFKSLINRIEAVATEEKNQNIAEQKDPSYERIANLAVLRDVLDRAVERGRLAIDTETTSLHIREAKLVGISLAVDEFEGFYLPLSHLDEFEQPVTDQLDIEEVCNLLRPVLADPAVLKIGHNLKYDAGVLIKYGLKIAGLDDTMLLSYVLDGAKHRHGLDELARLHLGYEMISYESLCGKGAKQISFAMVPVTEAVKYAAEDADIALRLWLLLKPRLFEEKLASVYETIDRPLVNNVAEMEYEGILVDRLKLDELTAIFSAEMKRYEEKAMKLAGMTFNIASPKQLGEVLYHHLEIPGGKKTKSGAYATGAEVLEKLSQDGYEIADQVLAWRQLQKLTRTYTESLVDDINKESGRVHTSYMTAATSTGRLSSTDPNLQNIPIRTEEGRQIREAFVAGENCQLLSADYSQIELRVLAHMADIHALKEAFSLDIDIHSVTAAQMFGCPVDDVSSELRRSAKMINYGIIYGIGAFGLAQRLGIPQKEAKAYIGNYFEQYPGIKDYMDETKIKARERGYVTTLFGRRCYIPDINAKAAQVRNYAERQAINAPIQGTAADIMKKAMTRVKRRLGYLNLQSQILLQVHDELVLEVKEDETQVVKDLVKVEMEKAANLSVPLLVDVGIGSSWGAAH